MFFNNMNDYYKILNVSNNATDVEIKKQYRKLSLQYHPDRYNGNDEKFKEYIKKQNTNTKNNILKSYDFFLNEKYNVVLNQKTIERVKNFFK